MPRPTRAMTVAALAAASVLAVLLAGCGTPGAPGVTSTPTSPTVTETPGALAPEPRFGLECSDLASAASVSALLRDPVAERDPLGTALAAWPMFPPLVNVRHLGGLVCEWSNGVAQSTTTGTAAPYTGASVSVLPDATAQWTRYVSTYSIVGDRLISCYFIEGFRCSFDAFAAGYWIEGHLEGLALPDTATDADATAAAAPFFDAIVAQVAAAGAPGPAWTPPAGTLPLPATCDGFVSPAQVQAALVTPTTLAATYPHGGWSQGAAAVEDSGDPGCMWGPENADAGIATLNWLPGGQWAIDTIRTSAPAGAPWETADVTIPGLEPGETAFARCIVGDEECYVDFVLGGNLIEVGVWREAPGTPSVGTNRRTAAVDIATAIVATLRP